MKITKQLRQGGRVDNSADRSSFLKPVASLVRLNSDLQSIGAKANRLSYAQTILNRVLPKSILEQSHIISITEAQVTLAVSDSATLCALRFQIPQLLTLFKEHSSFSTIKKIRLKVAQGNSFPTEPARPSKQNNHCGNALSDETIKILEETMSTSEEGPFKQALEKMIARRRPKDD